MLLWGGNISEMQENQGFPQSVRNNFVILTTSTSQLHSTCMEHRISARSKFSESRIINQDKKGHKDYMNIGNNIGNIMKITGAWNTFKSNHPKFPAFCQAVSRKGLREGSIIEIAITTPEGEKIETNLKIKDSDLELLKQLSDLKM